MCCCASATERLTIKMLHVKCDSPHVNFNLNDICIGHSLRDFIYYTGSGICCIDNYSAVQNEEHKASSGAQNEKLNYNNKIIYYNFYLVLIGQLPYNPPYNLDRYGVIDLVCR